MVQVTASPGPVPDPRPATEGEDGGVPTNAGLEEALAEAEGRLRLLDEGLAIAMWTTDRDLHFLRSAGSLLGAENSLVGTSLYEYFGTTDPGLPPIAAHLRALEGESTGYDVTWGDHYFRAFLQPLRDELGTVTGVVAVAVDLNRLLQTARKGRLGPAVRARHDRVKPEPLRAVEGVISVADMVIDPERFEVRKGGRPIPLTVTEFNLLVELAREPGLPLSRTALAERVWGHVYYAESPAVTMAISRLRDKIEDDPSKPRVIETIRGVGYRLTDGHAAP